MDTSLYKTTQMEILSHLAKRGYECHLIALYSTKKYKKISSDFRITQIPLRNIPLVTDTFYVLLLLFLFPLYVLQLRPNFIIVEPQDATAFSLLPIRFFPKSLRPKLILDARTAHFSDTSWASLLNDLTFYGSFHIAKRFFDGITTITPMMKSDFCKLVGLNPQNLGVWTSGVNTSLFSSKRLSEDAKMLRQKLGLGGKFVVIYHGSLNFNRGIIETIESVWMIKEKIPEVLLLLLGEGILRSRIEKMIDDLQLHDNVILLKSVDYEHVPNYIAVSDVGVMTALDLPHWRSQCPLKVLEYLSMAKVVIVSDIPSHRWVIGDCKCGIYVSADKISAPQIAEAIIYAYEHKSELAERGSIGRVIVERDFSWEKVAADFDNYLTQTARN